MNPEEIIKEILEMQRRAEERMERSDERMERSDERMERFNERMEQSHERMDRFEKDLFETNVILRNVIRDCAKMIVEEHRERVSAHQQALTRIDRLENNLNRLIDSLHRNGGNGHG